ncbi:chromate efflux transporter [Paludibacterium sp.]|uniref:chromate efflux transporter n=1 Tax=Paludibacterium sp. TaxID=1917523 RepID=UPI0025D88D07|nr:chromate efflux transporter [Paludibacterium sp.]MBV8645784.1 chromate efflux transporter [Paludibacterium sp.]
MTPATPPTDSLPHLFLTFLRLGCTSFGGPVAHIGYFREAFVARRQWLDDPAYGDLVALSQLLPGPASSQVGIGLGLMRRGLASAFVAWLGFTLPSAVALVLFGLLLTHAGGAPGHWLHGLKVVTVAVVAQAIWTMGRKLCPDLPRAALALATAVIVSLAPGVGGQLGVLCASALLGWRFLPAAAAPPHHPFPLRLSPRAGTAALVLFAALLALLPLWARQGGYAVDLFARFYRAGALVFGGGHVVLPMLQAATVPSGWVSNDVFLAGYGAAQAVPGPLFTFAAFLGAVSRQTPHGWLGAAVALVAIFLPGFLLMVGILPLWATWRDHPALRRAMTGVNAAVVGLLLAAFYQPVWTHAIFTFGDFALAAFALLALTRWRVPPWLVVLLCAGLANLIF